MAGGGRRRGGRRQGRAGANYGNRSDLQLGSRLPVQAPAGGQYGDRKRIEDLQRAVPLTRGPAPAAPGPGAGRGAPGPGPVPPAAPPPLDAPTQAPAEPVTAGSMFGPGPGPEVLPSARPRRISDLLGALGAGGDVGDMLIFARQRGL